MSAEIALYMEEAVEKPILQSLNLQDIVDSKILTSGSREALLAYYGNHSIVDRKRLEGSTKVGDELRTIINMTIIESGFAGTWEEREIQVFIMTIIQDIFRDFKRLTVQEVRIAFRKGVREEYGELHGLSVRAVHKWMRAYVAQTKKEAKRELRLLDKPKIMELTEEEKEQKHQDYLEGVYAWYDEFIKSGSYTYKDYGNAMYIILDTLGLMTYSLKEKKKIYSEAEEGVKNAHDPSNANGAVQRSEFKRMIQKIADGHSDATIRIKTEAKNIALKRFLVECRDKERNLRELIESAQASQV